MKVNTPCSFFYDCHCHILPGLDDGSRNGGETYRLLQMMYAEGIRTVIATPHFRLSKWKNSYDAVSKAFLQTQDLARRIDPKFRIYLWNEAFWEDGLIYHLQHGNCRVLGKGYVLVECETDSTEDTLRNMQEILCANGYIPVFAHIERYQVVRKKKEIVDELKEAGAWIQVNSDSITGKNGYFTARFCRKLLKQEKIDLIGTDCHRTDFRPPQFRKCADYILKNTSKDYYKLLMKKHPRKLLIKED